MNLSKETAQELLDSARSEELKKDMSVLDRRNRTPFMKDGSVNLDAYLEFLALFNEFINHRPKPFRKIIDRRMKL